MLRVGGSQPAKGSRRCGDGRPCHARVPWGLAQVLATLPKVQSLKVLPQSGVIGKGTVHLCPGELQGDSSL